MLVYSDVEMVEVTLYSRAVGYIRRTRLLADGLADALDDYRVLGWRIVRVERFTAYNYDVREV